MKRMSSLICLSLTVAGSLIFCVHTAKAASGTWNGTADAVWANSANWSASPYAGAAGSETATFANSGNSNTTLDLSGLGSILNVIFDTGAAAYTLGSGAQTLVLENGGQIQITAAADNDQTIGAAVQLGADTATATYSLRNDNPAQTLTINAVSGTTGGTKSLNLEGSGAIAITGNIAPNGSVLNLNLNSIGPLNLSGNNSMRTLAINGSGSVINLGSGTVTTVSNGGGTGITADQDSSINGPGALTLSTTTGDNHLDNGVATGKTLTINARLTGATGFEYWHGTYRGTFVLHGENDYTLNTIMNVPGTISVTNISNKGVAGNLGKGTTFIHNGANARLLYTGTGQTTDRTIRMQADGIIEQGGMGNLNFSDPITVSSGTKTLTLQGSTAGTGEFSGAIRNDLGVINLKKEGSGTWTLSADCTFTGPTAINGGVLALSGSSGRISGSSSLTLASGCEVRINNTAASNNTDRLRNAMPITLNGSTLTFSHTAGAVNYSETAGTVTINPGVNAISTSEAASGQTASVTLSGLVAGGGSVDFNGPGLGTSSRNRVFITGLADGLIGPWATVGGSSYAAYSSTLGIYAAGSTTTTNIAARGPDSVIPDDSTAIVHITTAGTEGPINLAGATVNSSFVVQQDTGTDATVAFSNKTMKVGQIQISAGQADLTLGASQGDGILTALNAGGSLTLSNQEPTSILTVNAAVNNNTSATILSKTGTGQAVVNGPLNYTGATTVGEGTLAFGGTLTQTLASVISGDGAVGKQGTGSLTLSGNNSYMGPTTVSAGILTVQNNNALGNKSAGTTVENGATLDLGGTLGAQILNIGDEVITISGAGVNGRGALINASNNSQYNAMRCLALAGNATIGGEQANGRMDIRNTGGTPYLQMNGYTLSKVGLNQFGLTDVPITSPGNINILEGSVTVEVGTTMGGSAANVMSVAGGAFFDFYQIYNPITWSLVMADNARLYARNGNVINQNIWAGPVSITGTTKLEGINPSTITLSGQVSGTGSLLKSNAGFTARLTHTNNTYTGTTTISGGTLYAQTPGSLPGYNSGKLTVNTGGILATHATDGNIGFTAEQIRDINSASSFTAVNAALSIDTSLANMVLPYDLTNRMGLTKTGSGTLNLAGVNTCRSDLNVNGGDLAFNSTGVNEIGILYVRNADLFLTNSAAMSIYTASNSAYIGLDNGNSGTMTVAGNAFWHGYPYTYNQPGGQSTLVIGNNGRGILNIKDNGSVRQRLYLGNYTSGAGAVYQNGGKMHNWGGAGSDGRIGMTGYGYYELNSGTFTNNGYFQLGRDYAGIGILKQSSGAFEMGSVYGGQLGISRGGTGVVYTAGGTFRTSSQLNVGESSDNGTIRGFADFTVDGTANAIINGQVWMADRTNMFATVNLNGGTLSAKQFSRSTRSGSLALVNFNGGTFRSRTAGNIFNLGANAVDAINIYAGGATFDTTNLICDIALPLRAPAGSGVQSISVAPTTGYIGPPMVTIAGNGTGATAIAQFNSTSGTLTGIQVTCPGYGYTSTPTVTLSGGGKTSHPTATATIGTNVSGGLTKLGPGLLTLSSTNTYGGTTTVSGGILTAVLQESLPADTDITVNGGTLNLGVFTRTNGSVIVTGGAIVGGSLICDSLTKSETGELVLATSLQSADPIVISGGSMRLIGNKPGLFEGVVSGSFDTSAANPNTGVTLSTPKMNTTAGWAASTTCIYSGFIWNNATTNVTWTFAENFDDNVRLKIDGNILIDNGGSWNVPTKATYTLTPGAHSFEVRGGQGGGGAGPVNSSWWTNTSIGFAVDYQGRNADVIGNYQALIDPGDGSLFTTISGGSENLIAAGSTVEMAPGTVLDLGGTEQTLDTLSGSGTVSNGTLAVSSTVAPGGIDTIGTLSVDASMTLTGDLLIDVATDGSSDLLAVTGNLNLSGGTLTVANPGQLDTEKQYIIATGSGTLIQPFAAVTIDPADSRWEVKYLPDGTVKLVYQNGILLILR